MANPTKEQWQQVEKELSYPYGQVELLCDGYKLNAVVKQESALKFTICIYVNGFMEGKWVSGGHEESTKFCCAKTRFLYKAAHRAEAKKKLAKRGLDQWFKDHYKKVIEASNTSYLPYWTSPAAFCRHIRKTCTSIELVKVGF